jgi:hypothetical protein
MVAPVLSTRHSDSFGMLSENMMNQKFKYASRFAKHTPGDETSTGLCPELRPGSGRNCIMNFSDFAIFADNYLGQADGQDRKSPLLSAINRYKGW